MKKAIKKEWVKALRSGKYKQAKKKLRTAKGWCCLGVLTDLYCKAKGISFKDNFAGKSTLPSEVAEWAGLGKNTDKSVINIKYRGKRTNLAGLNDGDDNVGVKNGLSFSKIAYNIEKKL